MDKVLTAEQTAPATNGLGPASGRNGDASGASMVFLMRLLLALSALLTLFVAPDDLGKASTQGLLTWLVFIAYLFHSMILLVAARRRDNPFWHGKVVYWLDLGWYGLMVYCSGGSNSFFFPFFFFVILTASFQWGFDEGARITLASTLVLALSTWLADTATNQAHLLLRTTFLLALGYMISYWGGLGLAQRRRLALLRRVSQLSNPRFGVDQTIASMLQQTRRFYGASNCLLLMRTNPDELWQLHSAGPHDDRPATLSRLSDAAAAPLLVFDARALVQYAAALHPRLPRTLEVRARQAGQTRWQPLPAALCEPLVDLLDASSFVSAPLPLRKGEGRIFVASEGHRLNRGDAVFLQQLAAQVFPVIENILLLDRLASDAAFRERQKIARDLHDTTIQPYIGLRHGISAVRQAMQEEHPCTPELDKLLHMTSEVISDMRRFAKHVRQGDARQDAELLVALRRQANQVREFYGIDIAINAAPDLSISDRLAAEVFQIINEGMSNIRKHTRARSGVIDLSNVDDQLLIRIANDTPEGPAAPFLPGSIAERTVALGGTIEVGRSAQGATTVSIAIPV